MKRSFLEKTNGVRERDGSASEPACVHARTCVLLRWASAVAWLKRADPDAQLLGHPDALGFIT